MGPKMGRERLARYSLTGPENQAAVEAGRPAGTGSAALSRASG